MFFNEHFPTACLVFELNHRKKRKEKRNKRVLVVWKKRQPFTYSVERRRRRNKHKKIYRNDEVNRGPFSWRNHPLSLIFFSLFLLSTRHSSDILKFSGLTSVFFPTPRAFFFLSLHKFSSDKTKIKGEKS